ncbi:MAG: GNAT family N-acetyltransferase [Thermoflexales bacterium]
MNYRSDALAIASAHTLSWREAYSGILPADFLAGLSIPDRARRWERIIDEAESNTDVAELDDQVLAFASYGRCRDGDAPQHRGEIWAIYATPASWGKGIGRALLRHVVAALAAQGYEETTLWVLSANQRGRRFYEANEFAPVPETEKLFALGGVHVYELKYLRRNSA